MTWLYDEPETIYPWKREEKAKPLSREELTAIKAALQPVVEEELSEEEWIERELDKARQHARLVAAWQAGDPQAMAAFKSRRQRDGDREWPGIKAATRSAP